jgi:hypothetical protein
MFARIASVSLLRAAGQLPLADEIRFMTLSNRSRGVYPPRRHRRNKQGRLLGSTHCVLRFPVPDELGLEVLRILHIFSQLLHLHTAKLYRGYGW